MTRQLLCLGTTPEADTRAVTRATHLPNKRGDIAFTCYLTHIFLSVHTCACGQCDGSDWTCCSFHCCITLHPQDLPTSRFSEWINLMNMRLMLTLWRTLTVCGDLDLSSLPAGNRWSCVYFSQTKRLCLTKSLTALCWQQGHMADMLERTVCTRNPERLISSFHGFSLLFLKLLII